MDKPQNKFLSVHYQLYTVTPEGEKELEDYAGLKDLAGIHMNYMRYEGAKSAENDKYTQAISDFAVNATGALRKANPNLILSSDVMPEYD